jgi:TolA-binding protein
MAETPRTCPACGASASGRFCNQCGAALDASCRACGSPLPAGARFCNECGAAVAPEGAAAGRRLPDLPWLVAGAALLALLAVLIVPRLTRGGDEKARQPPPFTRAEEAPNTPAGAPGTPAGDPSAVDLSQMTPRQAADRLFNRVMTAISQGDTAEARRFLPMAIMAYDRVEQLDSDGRYHLAALHLAAGDWDAARAQADQILAAHPTHLFGLFTAAQAEEGRGNGDEAIALYQRFLDAYPREAGRALPEYRDHQQAIPAMRQQAERAVR